jgi:hypothetical protein
MQPGAGQEPKSIEGGIPVYLLPDRDKRKDLIYTIQKDAVLKKEKTRWTEDPEIVDRMDHRHLPPPGRDKHGWGGAEKPVVNMYNVRPEPADGAVYSYKGNRIEEEEKEFQRGKPFIVKKNGLNGPAALFHQFYFVLIYDVFASSLYIIGMYIKYSHIKEIFSWAVV